MQKIKQRLLTYQNYLLKKTSAVSENTLITIFVGAAFFIALLVVRLQHGAINADSVLYFEAARLFSLGEWREGIALFPSPLYSILIAATHGLTGLNFEAAAQGLTALFFAITTFSFITLIRLAGGNKTTVGCGGLLLLSSSYIVGSVLPMLLRDQGFWAFFLTSLVFFIRFYRDGKIQDALLWQASCILAMSFRVEAITFLTLLPFVFLTSRALPIKKRLTQLLKAHALNLTMGILLIIAFAFMPSLSDADFGRLNEIWTLITAGSHHIAQQFTDKSSLMGNDVLGSHLDNYGSIGLTIALISIILLKTAKTAGWVSVGLIAYGLKDKKMRLKPDTEHIFIFVSGLALINIAAILLRSYILSSRYVIALAFILLIFSSFALAALFKSVKADSIKTSKGNFKKWLLVIAITILCLSFLTNIAPKRENYAYEKKAVEWVLQNTPKGSSIFYVSPRARYYAGVPYAGRDYEYWDYVLAAIKDKSINQYDYLVINLDQEDLAKQEDLVKLLTQHTLIREFVGFRGKKKILFFTKK